MRKIFSKLVDALANWANNPERKAFERYLQGSKTIGELENRMRDWQTKSAHKRFCI